MAASSSQRQTSLLSFFSLFSILTFSSSSSPDSITLSLSSLFTKTTHTNPWQKLNHLTASSLTRAHHLKHPHKNTSLTKTPLFPQSYGGYSISLSFGTPPQTLPFIMDTGSSLTWFPCTENYRCIECNFPKIKPSKISTFSLKSSSSSKLLGCKNPKCGVIYGPNVTSRCRNCDESSGNNCTCPPYLMLYGSGATFGLLLSETLNFPHTTVSDFLVGCSIISIQQASGIAGFGRGPESLPAQMGLKKFSYCLVSHNFDDTNESSDLVLTVGSFSGAGKSENVSYTRFHKNPMSSESATFQEFYYLTLRKITVGYEHVKIPYRFLVPGPDGNGGTIIDSGTTFTVMDNRVYEPVAQAFEKKMVKYSRAMEFENQTGLRPCFDVSGQKSLTFPSLAFHFKGGAKMELPLADYFSFLGSSGVVCMTLVSINGGETGPSIIIGNYQQQNFYLEYDLENERFGFRKQVCK